MGLRYEDDVYGWTREQAFWLRSGRLSEVDALNLADQLEDMNSIHEYDLSNRCSCLLAHLARWKMQEGSRCDLWRRLIDLQRERIEKMFTAMPRLRSVFSDQWFLECAWLDTLFKVIGEPSCYDLPDDCPWSLEQALSPDFFPE